MEVQMQLCRNKNGIIERQPIHCVPGETVDALVERILGKSEDYYGPGCYVPLGKTFPNMVGWLEIRVYREAKPTTDEGAIKGHE